MSPRLRDEDILYQMRLERFQASVLVDKFGLRLWEIARLSDRQIADFYFAPRDENGTLIVPTKPMSKEELDRRTAPAASLEEELAVLDQLQAHFRGSDGKGRGLTNYREAVQQVRAKWADGSRAASRAEWEAQQRAEDAGQSAN